MLLHQITSGNLLELERETKDGDRKYFDKLFARIQTENPLFAILASVMADNARATHVRTNSISADEIHRLVIDTCLYAIRALELAALDGTSKQLREILMSDPQMDTLAPERIEAIVHSNLIFKMLGVEPKKNS